MFRSFLPTTKRQKSWIKKNLHSKFILAVLIFTLLLLGKPVKAESLDPLILEPIIQGYTKEEYAYAYSLEKTTYVALYQLSHMVGLNTSQGDTITGYLGSPDRSFEIDVNQKSARFGSNTVLMNPNDVQTFEDQVFFSTNFYNNLFPFETSIDPLAMQLLVTADEILPMTLKEQARDSRKNKMMSIPTIDNINTYNFDNRWWSQPVIDLNYQKGFSKTNIGRDNEQTSNSDTYGVNVAMLAAGLDTNLYLFGNSGTEKDMEPRMRLTIGRTMLNQENPLNLMRFQMGDLSGIGSGYFAPNSTGRGMYASSFKDLIMSADKTIDITGPLLDGWEVELYWNEQIVGFRQSSQAGQYNFQSLPVSYGLNIFKLIFYGPYGEIRTEERRYYSGTSPVQSGQFGYTLTALQPDRYLWESNELYTSSSDKPVIDFVGYYGLSNYATLIGGYTMAQDAIDKEISRHFATLGLQTILSGASFQYNLNTDLESNKLAHHIEAQGNIYIGDIFARYDYYGDIKSPVSYYGNTYLKELFEARLNGTLAFIELPYYLSYQRMKDQTETQMERITARLSYSPTSKINLSIENTWQKNAADRDNETNDINLNFYYFWNRWTMNAFAHYQTHPTSNLGSYGIRADYRTNKNTYLSLGWQHDQHKETDELDTLTLVGGRVFPFGGLNLEMNYTSDKSASVLMNYNISLGKHPDKNDFFTDAHSKMSERGAILAYATDEHDEPLSDVQILINGVDREIYTNEDGEALVTDLSPYERTIVAIESESLNDISLTPQFDVEKWVLRPGTVLPLKLPFIHMGAFEGHIKNGTRRGVLGHQIQAVNENNEIVASTFTDMDGFFILDGVPFGTYTLIVLKNDKEVTRVPNIKLDDVIFTFNAPINVTQPIRAPQQKPTDIAKHPPLPCAKPFNNHIPPLPPPKHVGLGLNIPPPPQPIYSSSIKTSDVMIEDLKNITTMETRSQ